jgi:hypothetical protein
LAKTGSTAVRRWRAFGLNLKARLLVLRTPQCDVCQNEPVFEARDGDAGQALIDQRAFICIVRITHHEYALCRTELTVTRVTLQREN